MTPNEYAATIVLPTLREFLAARGDLRRAVLACIAIYHTIDYIAQARVSPELSRSAAEKARRVEAQAVRDTLAGICAASLAVVQGICNGTKHANPVETKKVPPVAYGQGAYGVGRFGGIGGVEVEHEGERLFVDRCAQAVMLTLRALYGTELDQLDLTFFDQAFRGQPGWQEPPTASN